MMQWRVRLMVVFGALVLAAPALARPEGTPGKRPAATAPTVAAIDSSESRNIEGDGGDDGDGLLEDLTDHFGW